MSAQMLPCMRRHTYHELDHEVWTMVRNLTRLDVARPSVTVPHVPLSNLTREVTAAAALPSSLHLGAGGAMQPTRLCPATPAS